MEITGSRRQQPRIIAEVLRGPLIRNLASGKELSLLENDHYKKMQKKTAEK